VLAEKAEAEVQIAQRDRTIAILQGKVHTAQIDEGGSGGGGLGEATEVS